jgi:tetratricopeptide (TPR) repeat protein
MFWSVPQFYPRVNDLFCGWKAPWDEVQKSEAAKHFKDAKIEEGPAIVVVDPDDGSLVDVLAGRAGWSEMELFLTMFERNEHRKGLERELENNKALAGDEKFALKYADALLRCGELKEARRFYETAKGSKDMKTNILAKVGLTWIEYREKDYSKAIEMAQDLFDEMPQEAPPRGTCLYIQVMAYYEQNKTEECQKPAQMLLERYIRTPYGFRLQEDIMDLRWDFPNNRKLEAPKPPEEPEK